MSYKLYTYLEILCFPLLREGLVSCCTSPWNETPKATPRCLLCYSLGSKPNDLAPLCDSDCSCLSKPRPFSRAFFQFVNPNLTNVSSDFVNVN